MARRNLRHNVALGDLVRNLPSGPLADGPPGTGWGLTGQREDLADLFVRNPDGLAGPRGIREALCDTEVGQGDGLESQPPGTPEPYGIDRHAFFTGNLA